MAPHFSRLFGFFHSKKGGRVITRQKMTYCALLFTVFGMLFFFSPATHALDQEVDPTYRGRQIDEVLFGLDHTASSLAHKEILIGEMQPTTFSLKAPHHEVSWDLTALKGGMHVLLIDCIILSDERAATPSYMNFSGDWVELPRMPFRSPWYDNNQRHYLIDLPPGPTRFKVKFSGEFPNMFYIKGARLYEQKRPAVNIEVDPSYAGRYIDRVLFGSNHYETFDYHNGILTGDVQTDTFSLKTVTHEVSWDFSALKSGRHVLLINCNIYSGERSATPFYLDSDGVWVELPRMYFREPWNEHNLRYYLIDLPPGPTQFKVKFSGKSSNMFYISGAKLFEVSNLLPDQEVSQRYAGSRVDQVHFGADTIEDFTRHNGSLNGEMQNDSFSLKTADHKIGWDFMAQEKGLHVLAIDSNILSDDSRATPYYRDRDGFWLELPEMRFRPPGSENNWRYFLLDLSPGVNRYKVEFSGKFSKMIYIRSARLYRIADAIDDHDPPLIIDYISAASAATFCEIRWMSNEFSKVEILYGPKIDQFEDSVSSDRFSEDHVITLSALTPNTRYNYQINLTDNAGNSTSYGPYDFTTDEFPFQISNVHFNGLTDNAATILWETDIASAGQLHYGTTSALANVLQDNGFATDHYIRLEGLLPDTVYFFKIEAYDETGDRAHADNHGTYYRFKTSGLNQTPLAVEIDGDGIDNDGDGFSDRTDPEGYLAVDTNIGTPESASDFIGSLEDKVDFGFRHWSVAAGDPIGDDTDIDDSMGAHNASNNGGRIQEVSIFGGTTEWDFNVSQPGFYILSLFGWWRDTRAYYFDSNQWQQLPQPSGHSAQYYLIRLSQPGARFKLENGYHFHAQIFQVGADPFSGAALNPVHPRLYFKTGDLQRLKDRIEDVDVLGNPTDSYRYFLLNGWGSASFYQAADFSAWQNLADSRTFANALSYLALAYVLTDNTDFADKLIEMLLLAASWDSGWGRDRSVLKNGEMLAGMAIAYDLVYNYLTPYQRDIIRRALDRECRYLWVKSINAEHYGDGEYWWASEKSNNWAAVAHGGLGAAALALLNESKYAQAYVDQAVKISKRFMDTNFDADGVYQESFMYYEYALEYLMIFVDALKNVTGIDLYRYNNDVIQKSTIWHLYGVEPSKASLTPFDNDTENGFVASPYLLAVASAYQDSLIMWHWNNIAGQHRNRAVHQSLNLGGTTHLVPLVLLWYDETVAQTSPGGRLPLGAVWPDFGRAVSLTGFESSDDIHFALQSGVGGFHGNHQDQGSFFLNAYGERLVGEGGVYNFEDSKYHNIIMIDDMGQGTPDLEQPKRAGIAGFLHSGSVDYVEADTTHAYAYNQGNPVQKASRQILFVRPTDTTAAYFVLLDQIEKGDGRTHNYEFLLHSTQGNPIESNAGNRFRIDGIQADLEIFFAQPAAISSSIETEHDVPVLKVAAASEQFDGLFFTLLFPTDAQHGLPEIRAIEASQASVMNVGEDVIVFNKTGASITHQNLKTDGQIAVIRENQDLDFAAVFKATELTYNHIDYVRMDSVTNIVFGISEDNYHLTIGNESTEKSNSAATVTLGGLIPRGTYCLTDSGMDQGCFFASENGFYALDTTLDRKHVYKIDYIAQ